MRFRLRHPHPLKLTGLCLVLGALAPVAAAPVSLPNPDLCLLTRTDAFVLDTPEVVAQGPVPLALWSPSGAHILALRVKPNLRAGLAGRPSIHTALVHWKSEGGRSREVWKSDSADPELIQFTWLPNSEIALALVQVVPPLPKGTPTTAAPRPVEHWLLRIDARRSSFHLLFRVPGDTRMRASPTHPLAYLSSLERNTLRLISASGAVREYSAPKAEEQITTIYWAEGGSHVAFVLNDRSGAGAMRPKLRWHLLDAVSGKITPSPTRPRRVTPPPPASQPFRIRTGTVTVREGETARKLQPLWLESVEVSERPRVLVAADSPGGFLSPKGDAVLYTSEGTAYVRRLVRMDRKLYLLAKAEAERTTVMSNLKHLGTALLIYAQDHQETLPSSDADLRTLLNPYLKQETVLEGFTYTYPGSRLVDITEPSKTLLGYAPVAGGRINLFVDGHVQYEPTQ